MTWQQMTYRVTHLPKVKDFLFQQSCDLGNLYDCCVPVGAAPSEMHLGCQYKSCNEASVAQ